MTKQDLEKAIENGESVWSVDISFNMDGFCINENKFKKEDLGWLNYEHFYKTKSEAEHYLHHANITRTETLPFLTWKEFKSGKEVEFSYRDTDYTLCLEDNEILLCYGVLVDKSWDLTEENFYKAYDECVKLFKGENDE